MTKLDGWGTFYVHFEMRTSMGQLTQFTKTGTIDINANSPTAEAQDMVFAANHDRYII